MIERTDPQYSYYFRDNVIRWTEADTERIQARASFEALRTKVFDQCGSTGHILGIIGNKRTFGV